MNKKYFLLFYLNAINQKTKYDYKNYTKLQKICIVTEYKLITRLIKQVFFKNLDIL